MDTNPPLPLMMPFFPNIRIPARIPKRVSDRFDFIPIVHIQSPAAGGSFVDVRWGGDTGDAGDLE